ncbi:MAG: low molecular weight phosphatase family protein [Parvularculales bacterium]
MENPGAVLFACNYNAVRSPMAEALMKHLCGQTIYVDSCGVRSGELDSFCVEVLWEVGIEMDKHRPKSFSDLQDTSFDLIFTLTPEAHHQALELTRTMAVNVEYWPTMDPTIATGSREQVLMSYRQVRDALNERLRKRFSTDDS